MVAHTSSTRGKGRKKENWLVMVMRTEESMMKYVVWLWKKIVINGMRQFLVMVMKDVVVKFLESLRKKITVTSMTKCFSWQSVYPLKRVKPKSCHQLQGLLTSVTAMKWRKSFRLVHTTYSFHPTNLSPLFSPWSITWNDHSKYSSQAPFAVFVVYVTGKWLLLHWQILQQPKISSRKNDWQLSEPVIYTIFLTKMYV